MSLMNRMYNASNRFQGPTKKVLCVCSAGLLRSPTVAHILSSPPWNFNTRAAGITSEMALIPVDSVLVSWADDIVVMEEWMADKIREDFLKRGATKPVHVVKIPDQYEYRDPYLVKLVTEAMHKLYPRVIDE